MNGHPDIDNRLACIVRDVYEQEYLKLAMAVVAVFGLHLIEPFHAKTISKSSNHNTLTIFFKNLHEKMDTPIAPAFFELNSPWYPGISVDMFNAVKESYGIEVVASVKDVVQEHLESAVKLANHMQPGLRTTLGRQRRDYGISDEFLPEFPVDELSDKVKENAPTHNLDMESKCGLVGHRTSINRHLEATSRSIILQGTKALREKYGGSFRDFNQAVRRVKGLKLIWKKKQEEVAGTKISRKESKNLRIEGRVLKQLLELKKQNGPFTDCESVDRFLSSSVPQKEKKARMKMEIQYARDTSLSVPKTNPIFRIRTPKVHGKKATDLSAEAFGENLKTLISKKVAAAGKTISIQEFMQAMDTL